jgi:hypothetical protein
MFPGMALLFRTRKCVLVLRKPEKGKTIKILKVKM